jgi:hypothetical protein
MIGYAVRKRIHHLCAYITDKTAVMHHVNREFNLRLTVKDIDWVLSRKGKERPRRNDLEAMLPSPLIVTHKRAGHDPLALALFKYHAARTAGPEQVYWLERLNDRKPKPTTEIEL